MSLIYLAYSILNTISTAIDDELAITADSTKQIFRTIYSYLAAVLLALMLKIKHTNNNNTNKQ
jgi:hypothetical protein